MEKQTIELDVSSILPHTTILMEIDPDHSLTCLYRRLKKMLLSHGVNIHSMKFFLDDNEIVKKAKIRDCLQYTIICKFRRSPLETIQEEGTNFHLCSCCGQQYYYFPEKCSQCKMIFSKL